MKRYTATHHLRLTGKSWEILHALKKAQADYTYVIEWLHAEVAIQDKLNAYRTAAAHDSKKIGSSRSVRPID